MAYNVQFKKVLTLPVEPSNHVFYAVYEKKSAEGAFENLQKVYLGNIELSSVAVDALINSLDAKLAEEIARAKAAEEVNARGITDNKAAIEAEVTRATAAENANKAAIEAEVARASAAEAANTKKIDDDINALRAEIGNISNIMNFRGAYTELPTPLDAFTAGDVIIITEGVNAGKEYVLNETDGVKAWVEIGHASATDAALAALAERVTALEGKVVDLESRATALEGRATVLETRATTIETDLANDKADLALFKTTVAETYATKTEVTTLNENLTKAINDEKVRAEGVETVLDTAIKAEADRASKAETALDERITSEVEALNKAIVDYIAKIYGDANQDTVDLGKLVGAINQLVDSANTSEEELATVTTSVKELDERVAATENLLTWEE